MKLSATQILAIGAVGLAGFVVVAGVRKAGEVATALNPANSDNIVNRGFNEFLQGTGIIERGSSLGSAIFDLFNPEFDPNRMPDGSSSTQGAS